MKRLPLNWKLIKIIDIYPLKLFSRFVMRRIEKKLCDKNSGLVGISPRFYAVNR